MSNLSRDALRGKEIAETLYHAYVTTGIHGHCDMPEDTIPNGVQQGSREHTLFITLTVAIDYQRDAHELWECSRKTYEDPSTRYLYDPLEISKKPFKEIFEAMHKYRLSRKPTKDAEIWQTVATSFQRDWEGDPQKLLAYHHWDARRVLEHLKSAAHKAEFPYLSGDKIGPLWMRMLRDNVGIDRITNLNRVPIPVDIHVARASLALGVVRGKFDGRLQVLFEDIRSVWFDSVKKLSTGERDMMALDLDEPLWHLSKYGCTHRDKASGACPVKGQCELSAYCWQGKIAINRDEVALLT